MGLFSIVLEPCPKPALAAMIEGLELFGIGASWGGYESLVLPFDAAKTRSATAWQPEGPTVRLHIGLEDVSDLIIRKNIHSAVFDSPKAMDFLEGVLRGIDRNHIAKAA